jgi:hypothetical protein
MGVPAERAQLIDGKDFVHVYTDGERRAGKQVAASAS